MKTLRKLLLTTTLLILSGLAYSSNITPNTKAVRIDFSKIKGFKGFDFNVIEELHGSFSHTDNYKNTTHQIYVDSQNIILNVNESNTYGIYPEELDTFFAKKPGQSIEEALNQDNAIIKVKPFKVGFKRTVIGITIQITRKTAGKNYNMIYLFKKDSWEKVANNTYAISSELYDEGILDETSSVGESRSINLKKIK